MYWPNKFSCWLVQRFLHVYWWWCLWHQYGKSIENVLLLLTSACNILLRIGNIDLNEDGRYLLWVIRTCWLAKSIEDRFPIYWVVHLVVPTLPTVTIDQRVVPIQSSSWMIFSCCVLVVVNQVNSIGSSRERALS
jgi:hypothetical protein